jgi:glycerophosphoryl diester phosphodiesterase
MNKYIFSILIAIAFMFLQSCLQKDYDASNTKTKILGHRGYGIKAYNDTIMDNTIPAVVKALHIANGVEVDIQLSKDNTIWLYHDTKIIGSDSTIYYIPHLNDKEVLNCLSRNHPNSKFNALTELFEYFNNNQITCFISLDIKSFYGENCFENTIELRSYMQNIGEKILNLAEKYNLEEQILIESDIKFLLDFFKKNSDIKTFLLGFSGFNKHVKIANKKNYTGISHNYKDSEINPENISFAKNKGLQIQLWTPNSANDLESVLLLNPDFIQTDNINYFKDTL